MSLFRMADRLSGRWPDSQGFCGVRDFDEPQVRRDGQKVLLAMRNMGGESEAAWRAVLDDLVARKMCTPELLIVDGAAGLEPAVAALWAGVPVQPCTVCI